MTLFSLHSFFYVVLDEGKLYFLHFGYSLADFLTFFAPKRQTPGPMFAKYGREEETGVLLLQVISHHFCLVSHL